MANEIQLRTSLSFQKGGAGFSRQAALVRIDVAGELFVDQISSAVIAGALVDKGDLTTIGLVHIKNLDTLNYIRVGDDGTNYPIKLLPGESFSFRLNGDTLYLKSYAVAQVETFTCVADVAASLDGTYLQLNDSAGSVGVWIDVDNSGTTIPAGASALDRAIEVTGIVTGGSAVLNAIAVAAAINGDSEFSATAADGVVTVTQATAGPVADGAAGDTGFTAFTVVTNGENPIVKTAVALIEE